MRGSAFIPLLALAACSDGPEAAQQPKSAAVDRFQPGQWEVTSEVTAFNQADQGKPRIDTPVGTRATTLHCLTEADAKKPAPALFAPAEDSCTYRDSYISGGRLNASLDCKRPGLAGQVLHTVNGSYTGTGIEATRETQTYLSSDGDVRITARITGRHVGQCTGDA